MNVPINNRTTAIAQFLPRCLANIVSEYDDTERMPQRHLMTYVMKELKLLAWAIDYAFPSTTTTTLYRVKRECMRTGPFLARHINWHMNKYDLWDTYREVSIEFYIRHIKKLPYDVSPKRICAHCDRSVYKSKFSCVANMCQECYECEQHALYLEGKRVYIKRPTGYDRYPIELKRLIVADIKNKISLREIHRRHSPAFPILKYFSLAKYVRLGQVVVN